MNLQDCNRREAGLLFVLNVGHVKEIAAREDSRRHPVKQWIAAFQDLKSIDG